MIKRHFIIAFAVAITAFACEPEPLPIQLDLPSEQLVVSSLLVQEQGITIGLTRSFSALNGGLKLDSSFLNSLLVREAEVLLIENRKDTFILEKVVDGIFASFEIDPQPGRSYRLMATDVQLDLHVEAESTVKESVNFSDINGILVPTSGVSIVNINYSFATHPNENLYMVNVQKFSLDSGQGYLDLDQQFIEPGIYTHLITKTHAEMEQISGTFDLVINQEFNTGDTLIASLASIEPIYHDYLKKRNNMKFRPSFVSEPYNAPSNVENGRGFFNLHSPDIRMIIVE